MSKKIKALILLHLLMLIYSFSTVCSKLAADSEFMSVKYILCYGGVIFILGIYAIMWQQVIKVLPLSIAFANKAVTVVWGLIWGMLLFGEQLSLYKTLGAGIVIAGVIIYVSGEEEEKA